MTVLDAYAVLAFLKDEPAASAVVSSLGAGAALTVLGVAEVVDHLVRVVGVDEETAVLDLAELGLLDGIQVDPVTGLHAGGLRGRHYHRTKCAVSLADCVAAAAAERRRGPLVTSDPHLLDMCVAEGIEYTPLPGSDGSIWTADR